ncbi:MAG TPA: D-aminoacyl-tRNA deacylase [Candidatus Bathyarchaeia archaeon]|nr:D-aminoacyl-tRNA deacylase [Candidatus Bathyarchaeia archaeon]
MILLIASGKDTASINIAEHVLKHYPFAKTNQAFQETPVYSADIAGKKVTFIMLKEEAVNAQDLPDNFVNLELMVFISRHSSQSGKPTLSVHTPGNFASAELGGLPSTVSISPANAMQDALKALKRLKEEMRLDYEVTYECTHHGPSLNVPAMFVELGSSPKQWSDLNAASAVAQAAMEAIINFGKSKQPAVLGIGGTHYNQKFTNMALNGEAAFGHMIPKYAIQFVDSEILRQCLERTLERNELAILDWKGIKSEDKQKLLILMQEVGLPFKKA